MPQNSLTVVATAAGETDAAEEVRPEAKLPIRAIGGWNLRWGAWRIDGWERVGLDGDAVLYLGLIADPSRRATIPCKVEHIRRLEGDIPCSLDETFELTLTIAPTT